MQYGNPIIAPHALPQFKQIYVSAKKRLLKEKEEKEEREKEKYVPGSSSTYQQYIMQMINKNTQRDRDPREAILEYKELAEKEAVLVGPAYQLTQPKPIYNYEAIKEDENEESSNICPKCGLKY
mmetsp:Transcript_20669/g.20408  ORF Transcript_20669/g.20408 Transcript_20669/m.20408 type:complete len:124 (+) Transcript_20669:706-1077(+)